MSDRKIKVGAAQLGPINLDHSRQEIIQRLFNLMMEASDSGADLVVYPELALTTFFPRWFIEEEDSLNLDDFYETEMPNSSTQILFETAKKLKIGFSLGYAELTKDGHRYNPQSTRRKRWPHRREV
ncbi:MAG: hypothetical protein Ct9H90mP11_04430 [Acidimicrobiales bacterium]|nr:MAG: hypothetical protein Ct9H90mP11_04430 [Acidimicrobiales bacterium]